MHFGTGSLGGTKGHLSIGSHFPCSRVTPQVLTSSSLGLYRRIAEELSQASQPVTSVELQSVKHRSEGLAGDSQLRLDKVFRELVTIAMRE